jgi:hypothetical protein
MRLALVLTTIALLSGCTVHIGPTPGTSQAHEPTIASIHPATTAPPADPGGDNGHLVTSLAIEIEKKDVNGDGDTDVAFRLYGRDANFIAQTYRGEGKLTLQFRSSSSWQDVGFAPISADPARFNSQPGGPHIHGHFTANFFQNTGDYRFLWAMTLTKNGAKLSQTLDFTMHQSRAAAASSSAATAPLTFKMNDDLDRLEVTSAPTGVDWGKIYVLTCNAGKFGINAAPTYETPSCAQFKQAPGGTSVVTGDVINLCRRDGAAWLDVKIRWQRGDFDRPEFGPFKFANVVGC